MNTRQFILALVVILLIVGLGVWWYFGFSIDFMRFFAAEPNATNKVVVGGSNAASVTGGMVTCSPATQNIPAGSAATVTASNGTGAFTWFAPESVSKIDGGDTRKNQTELRYATTGIKQVTVQATRGDTAGSVDSVACTIVVTPMLSI